MVKYLDKTQKEWDEIVEKWHNDDSITISLQEYMELDEIEYLRYVHSISEPNLSAKEVQEEASKRGRQAFVGLMLMGAVRT